VAVALMGGLVAMLVAARALLRYPGGLLVAISVGVLLFLVAATAGVTVLHRVTSTVRNSIESGVRGLEALQTTPAAKPAATATAVPGPPPALLSAERQVAAMGYQVGDPGTYHPEYALHVLIGVAAGAPPHHERAFFFADQGRLLGEDDRLPSAGLLVVGQGPATVALAYQLYAADDEDCCPSLGKAAVRFRLDRGRLRRLDRSPTPPPGGHAARRGRRRPWSQCPTARA